MLVRINQKQLRALRKQKRFTQEKLAELVDMSERQLRSIETMPVDPLASTLYKLARELETPMEELLLIQEEEE